MAEVYEVRRLDRAVLELSAVVVAGTITTAVVVGVTVIFGILTTGAGPHAGDNSDAKALAQCFSRLEGLHRQAIALAFYHDLSHSEVAEQMKLPLGTVKTWVRRGLDRLRTCLTRLERA